MSRHPKTNITLSSHHGSIPVERESRSFIQSKSEYNNLGDKVIKLCSATKSGDNEGDKTM